MATAPAAPASHGEPFGRRGAREPNCSCTQPERTGHVPGCPLFADALYGCEAADERTIKMLAATAHVSVAELERKRLDFAGPDENCSDDMWPTRRRCWRCPFWERHGLTPL